MTLPLVTISILAYQNLNLTRRCIESVMANSGDLQRFQLILTDNACQDGTSEYFDQLEEEFPNITVLHNRENQGFIKPNRLAFGLALGRFFVMLNNDATVPPGWLDVLLKPFEDPQVALAGPDGNCCQLRGDFHGERGPRKEYLEGSCLMVNRELVERFEPNLFALELDGAYGEDSYLSLRCREMGYRLAFVSLMIAHVRGATADMVPRVREWQAKNHLFLQKRFRRYMRGHRFDYPIILKRTAAWGDVLLITPIAAALRIKHPQAQILVETVCGDCLHGNPAISYVSPQVGFVSDADEHNLNGISEMKPNLHIVDAYAQCVGLEPHEYAKITKIYPLGGDIEWAKRELQGNWIAIHPGPTSWATKNWPVENWNPVIAFLQGRGFRIVLVGNDHLPILSSANLDLRCKTSVAQLAAALGEVKLFIGLDSFPIHVAQAMGTSVVGLFGVTDPALILTNGSGWWAAESDPAHPATKLRHKKAGLTRVDHPSNPMDTITVPAVLAKIEEALS